MRNYKTNSPQVIAGICLQLLLSIVDYANAASFREYGNTVFRLNAGIIIPFYIYFGFPMFIVGLVASLINTYVILKSDVPFLGRIIIITLAHLIYYKLALFIKDTLIETEEFDLNLRKYLIFIGWLFLFFVHQMFGFSVLYSEILTQRVIYLTLISFFSGVISILIISPVLIVLIQHITKVNLIRNSDFDDFSQPIPLITSLMLMLSIIVFSIFMINFLEISLSFLNLIFIPALIIATSNGIRKAIIWNFLTFVVILANSPFILPSLDELEKTLAFQVEIVVGSFLVILLGLNYSISMAERHKKEEIKEDLRYLQRIETIDNLAGGVSHDMANFIQVIYGYLDFLEVKSDSLRDDELKEIAQNMRITTERASELAKQMLTISKRQVGKFEETNLNTFLLKYKTILEKMVDTSIAIEWKLGNNLPLITVDRTQIQQVLFNLILNAKEAMQDGGKITLSTQLEKLLHDERFLFLTVPKGEYLVLSVSDVGTGIDPSDLPKIFDPFFTKKTIGTGNGLGLTMVLSILRKHQAYINVQSSNLGTKFDLYFDPKADLPSNITTDTIEKTEFELSDLKSVLIVDDEIEIANSIKRILTSKGIETHISTSMQELRNNTDFGSFDLVILDIIMPDGSGLIFAQELQDKIDNLPILFISGYPADYFKNFDLSSSKFGFLHKPFTQAELLENVKETILKIKQSISKK